MFSRDIYLDHASLSPQRPVPVGSFYNPSSLHALGKKAQTQLTSSRAIVAEELGAQPEEIIFTSGGTESINLALLGVARANKEKGTHIVSTTIEHKATLNALKQLETEGFEVTYIAPQTNGIVSADTILEAVTNNTVLVSVMYVNNELGTIQPVSAIGKALEKREQPPYFHIDACQASGYLSLHVHGLHADLLSMNTSKIGGPVGVGVLYRQKDVKLQPLLFGGNQEWQLRPGTEPVGLIATYANVFKRVRATHIKDAHRVAQLRTMVREHLSTVEGITVLGAEDQSLMAPHILSLHCQGVDAEELQSRLSAKGIFVGLGSACTTQSNGPSHVLSAIGLSAEESTHVIRLSFGYSTTEAEVRKATKILIQTYTALRV